MRQARQLWLPFSILLLTCFIFSLFLPFFPVDETRYLGVAWEMRLNDSFIVPLQNALPYSHKPPLLFWLINLDWAFLGMNYATLRFIPLLFSLFNVYLVFRMALLLWEDEQTARHAALILASTLSYLLWSSLIMFDVVLACWVLLAVCGFIAEAKAHGAKWVLMSGVAVGAGILTKGPVILVYVLPVALFAFLWIPREKFSGRWYAWLGLSLALGIAVVLLWLVPAALTGGESYRKAILWGQTVNRVANSFAHKRPLWWYLPWIPVLLLPWILFTPTWRGCRRLAGDAGTRLVMLWIVSTVVIFSLVSGKQVHYLVPILPAFSLLMAKNLSAHDGTKASRRHFPVAALYLFLGAALFLTPFIKSGHLLQYFGAGELKIAASLLFSTGAAMLFLRGGTLADSVKYTAVASFVLCAAVIIGGNTFFHRYDLHGISEAVRAKQSEGYQVIHQGKYHGQFHFVGKLQQPLVALEDKKEIARYVATHDKVALITYERQNTPIEPMEIFFRQPFRSKQVVLWNKNGIARLAKEAGIAPADASITETGTETGK